MDIIDRIAQAYRKAKASGQRPIRGEYQLEVETKAGETLRLMVSELPHNEVTLGKLDRLSVRLVGE